MRKFYLLLSFSILLHFIPAAQQDGLYQFSDAYFRSNPFKAEFSTFLKHLLNDPDIKNKSIQQRTDSSLFSFSGVYEKYNPFFFRPERLEILLQETSFEYGDSLSSRDTIFLYQLIAYTPADDKAMQEVKKEYEKIKRKYNKKFFDNNGQALVTGNMVTGEVCNYFVPYHGLSPLSIAWSRVHQDNALLLNIGEQVRKDMGKINRQNQYRLYEKNSLGLISVNPLTGLVSHTLAPLSLVWSHAEQKDQMVLNITLRLKTQYNQAVLPAPLNNP